MEGSASPVPRLRQRPKDGTQHAVMREFAPAMRGFRVGNAVQKAHGCDVDLSEVPAADTELRGTMDAYYLTWCPDCERLWRLELWTLVNADEPARKMPWLTSR